MGATTGPTPVDMTPEQFKDALDRYAPLIEAVSASKAAKSGQKTLAELDQYRYASAPALFSGENPGRTMQLDDVKALVEWKLKHGKFRPTLMKLVSSNDPKVVEDTVKSALDAYKQEADASAAIDILAKLRGIGPATASLLLAVHYPGDVIFFGDEAFYWLCGDGKRCPIKYNAKEYRQLNQSLRNLAERLHVKAVDAERVAYVLMNNTDSASPTKQAASAPKKVAGVEKTAPAKRNQDHVEDGAVAPRRSKRGRPA